MRLMTAVKIDPSAAELSAKAAAVAETVVKEEETAAQAEKVTEKAAQWQAQVRLSALKVELRLLRALRLLNARVRVQLRNPAVRWKVGCQDLRKLSSGKYVYRQQWSVPS